MVRLPCKVCTARCRASLIRRPGCWAARAMKSRTTARCSSISRVRMSSRTGSIPVTGPRGGAGAGRTPGAGRGVATQRSASAIRAAISVPGVAPISSCSSSSGRAAIVRCSSASSPALRARLPSISRFRIFSTLQQYSPISSAPTMRPLPLSVWNARRTVCSASLLSSSRSQAGNASLMVSVASRASSMKSSRISGSIRCSPPAMTGRSASGVERTRVATSVAGSSSSVTMAAGSGTSACAVTASSERRALSSIQAGSLRPACSVSR